MSEDHKGSTRENGTNSETLPSSQGGPRTAQGKSRTKYNATGHGIFAKIVLCGQPFAESVDDYKRLLNELRAAINPADSLQDIQVQELAFEYLRMSRVYKADAVIAQHTFDKLTRQLNGEEDGMTVVPVGRFQQLVTRKELDPELIVRYGNSVSKQIHRILGELGRLPTEKR